MKAVSLLDRALLESTASNLDAEAGRYMTLALIWSKGQAEPPTAEDPVVQGSAAYSQWTYLSRVARSLRKIARRKVP